jgi:hypothetical protein
MKNWSISTTLRSPDRVKAWTEGFKRFEGESWNKAVMVAYDPELLNQVIYTGLVNILDSIRRNTFKPEDVTSLKKGLIYEVDDVVFREVIPDYNVYNPAFDKDDN